jgi:hypothetical protein
MKYDFCHLFNVIVANSRLVHPICFHAEFSSVSKHGKATQLGGKCSTRYRTVSYVTVLRHADPECISQILNPDFAIPDPTTTKRGWEEKLVTVPVSYLF